MTYRPRKAAKMQFLRSILLASVALSALPGVSVAQGPPPPNGILGTFQVFDAFGGPLVPGWEVTMEFNNEWGGIGIEGIAWVDRGKGPEQTSQMVICYELEPGITNEYIWFSATTGEAGLFVWMGDHYKSLHQDPSKDRMLIPTTE